MPSSSSPAVAIPCYNEAAAIGDLVRAWRRVLPEAEIFVFDNNSTDATAALAAAAGANVVPVPRQGKGFAVQAIFTTLRDRPAVILTDGDGTYPPEAAPQLLAPILADQADMVVAARRPVPSEGQPSMAPLRGLGNTLIRLAFHAFIGQGPGDLLSGYRAFGPRFLTTVSPRSSGFEIETELTGAAVAGRFRVLEVEVPYLPRTAGTTSKLQPARDGLRILGTILRLAARLRPVRLAIIAIALIALAALGLVCVVPR